MKDDFDMTRTVLSKISHTKVRTDKEGDPTKSDMPKRSLYLRPYRGKDGCICLGLYENRRWWFDSRQDSLSFGKPKGNWVYFDDERQRTDLRAFRTRFDRVVLETKLSWKEKILSELKKIASPFDMSREDSEYLGLFFDGTSNFREQSDTSIYELYNIYAGNKIYYGGVGNSIENNFSGLKQAFARGFEYNVERAKTDLEEYRGKTDRPMKIQL